MGARMSVVKADRNMQVPPESLEHREQPGRMKEIDEALPDDGALLKKRIIKARALTPPAHDLPTCRACFEKGRDAAILAIEGVDE